VSWGCGEVKGGTGRGLGVSASTIIAAAVIFFIKVGYDDPGFGGGVQKEVVT
jgi:hypothetical protein